MSSSSFRSSTATTEQQSPTQWVEIIEPKSKEKMYANLQTGSCVWDAPEVSESKTRSSITYQWDHQKRTVNYFARGLFTRRFAFKPLTRNTIVNIAPLKSKIEENEIIEKWDGKRQWAKKFIEIKIAAQNKEPSVRPKNTNTHNFTVFVSLIIRGVQVLFLHSAWWTLVPCRWVICRSLSFYSVYVSRIQNLNNISRASGNMCISIYSERTLQVHILFSDWRRAIERFPTVKEENNRKNFFFGTLSPSRRQQNWFFLTAARGGNRKALNQRWQDGNRFLALNPNNRRINCSNVNKLIGTIIMVSLN